MRRSQQPLKSANSSLSPDAFVTSLTGVAAEGTKKLPPEESLKRFLDPKFPKQSAFIADRSQFIDAQCSRRAGKSNGLALRFFHTMETHPGSQCVYLALTRDSAKEIMWPVLEELDKKYAVGCTFTESKLTVVHPNGAKLILYGADQKNFIKRLKGRKFPGIAIDEAQDFGSHLQTLIDDVLSPALADYEDSWLALVGTPGPVPIGYFFQVTNERKYGYSHHEWTLFENPFLPNAKPFVEALKKKRGWEDNHPTFLREYNNLWVLDTESLLIKYSPEKNHYDALPVLPPGKTWHHITGVDLGLRDADALGTIAWSDVSDEIYLVNEEIATGHAITELAEALNANIASFSPLKLPTDEGALGKKIAEEIRRRFKIPLIPADKTRKMENVTLLNDYLKRGKFKAKKDSRFAQDSYRIQIDWDKTKPDKIVIKSGFHSDIVDAVLYAFRESPAYTYEVPKSGPKVGSKEWAKAEEERMFQEALERMREDEKQFGNYGDAA
jgi:hypothetical protein